MAQAAQAPVTDRYAATSAQRERIHNTSDHRYTDPRSGQRNTRRHRIVHRIADRGVVLRRLSTRRRLARLDPEVAERKAWRIIGGPGDGDGDPGAGDGDPGAGGGGGGASSL